MRKETVNTFTEGLIKDLHPLNTPANVLTDALNATLINYDGNEYILQNDVGNGRVETARLPSGYIPIGMKEYGGIIYVASYNPLNGKSQIGSFPSPERQIGTEELGRSFSINANINTNNAYIRLDIYDENKKDLYKLNPGDKFIIASSGISKYINSQYEGILKIHIGVVDRENNIIYIEDDLKDPYIIDTSDISSNNNFQVFTSKTSGYLTIIIELLTIDTFNITRNISLQELNVGESISKSNPKFKIVFDGNSTSTSRVTVKQFKFTSNLGGPYYSTTPNLQLGLEDLTKKDILEYVITPICDYGELFSFAVSGKIDFSILGTGYNKLTEWRYYSDRDYLKLNWGMDYDPIKFVKVKNVRFTFYDFTNNLNPVKFKGKNINTVDKTDTVNYYSCSVKDNYNGNFSEKIPYVSDTTIYGLKKNNMYFVKISMDFINQSGATIKPATYYRILYTTGIFNKDFVLYKEKDFANFTIGISAKVQVNPSIENKTLTPQAYPSELVTVSNPFIGISSIYNVEGKLNAEIKLDKDTYFGELNSNIKLRDEKDSGKKYGISIDINNEFDSKYSVVDSPNYLGTTLTTSETLEKKLSEKYDPENKSENDRGIIYLEKSKIGKDKDINFNISGALRRGMYISETEKVASTFNSFTLVKAVNSKLDLNDYIASGYYGEPNSMLNGMIDTNHLQISGSVFMASTEARIMAASMDLKRNDGLPEYSNLQSLGKSNGNVSSIFDNEAVNSPNQAGLKHPIVFMIPSSQEQHGRLGRELYNSRSEIFQGVVYDKGSKSWGYIDDYISVAWKTGRTSYVFLNIGGVIAWDNKKVAEGAFDPMYPYPKSGVDGCTLEYPREISGKKLTILDILYNYLNSLYIPQWEENTVDTVVPKVDSIVYHGSFDNFFKIKGNYNINIDNNNLFSFNSGSKVISINSNDINTYINQTLHIDVKEFGSFIKNNVTTTITNLNEGATENVEFEIDYELGKNLNLTEWYSRISGMSLGEYIPKEGSVYIKDTKNTKDGNGEDLKLDVVYIYKDDKFVPYDGKVVYPDGKMSNTESNFLAIERPADKKKKAVLYVRPTVLSSKELEIISTTKNGKLAKLDVKSELYPGCEMFSRTII